MLNISQNHALELENAKHLSKSCLAAPKCETFVKNQPLLFYVWHVEIGTKGVGAWTKPLKFGIWTLKFKFAI